MSYCGAIPVDTEPSDSHILIDACLASVRTNAGLDSESVLVPLKKLMDEDPPKRVVVGPSARELPTAEAIVRSAVKVSATSASTAPSSTKTSSQRDVATVPDMHTLARRMRWPVFVCGFVAGIFGGIAVMKSPVGQRPAVQSVVNKAQSHISSAWAARSRIVHLP